MLLPGVFAPSLVALGLIAKDEGASGVKTLLSRLFEWRVSIRWYLFAFSYMAVIMLAVALVHRLFIGAGPLFRTPPWFSVVVSMIVSVPVRASEEIGWRGYALPRLSARFGIRWASVVLGPIWACWHLPLFIQGMPAHGQSFAMFVLEVTALSVAMAWLYSKSQGSLLLVTLMHSAINETLGLVPIDVLTASPIALGVGTVAWLIDALLLMTAIGFLLRMPKATPEGRDGTA
jgi:membrane protease YdiL (CAAX protease family)